MSRNIFTQTNGGEHLYFLTVHMLPLFADEITVLDPLIEYSPLKFICLAVLVKVRESFHLDAVQYLLQKNHHLPWCY